MPVPVDSLTIFSFPRTSDYICRLSPNPFRIAVGPFGSLQACAYCIHVFVAARSAIVAEPCSLSHLERQAQVTVSVTVAACVSVPDVPVIVMV